MTYKIILTLNDLNLDDWNISKGFLRSMGFWRVNDIVSVGFDGGHALMAESDDWAMIEFVKTVAKRFGKSSCLVVLHTGAAFRYYFNTGIKVFENNLFVIDGICYKMGA